MNSVAKFKVQRSGLNTFKQLISKGFCYLLLSKTDSLRH
ncbi:hypothetical protein D1BOALGB6SA_9324 [Olavius sp. associated proteobacterium Delta 1]|nr:hypothetical protein D1BOALGB6SA_9324 [Olavius sp. associated proteobacterium Delta 1]